MLAKCQCAIDANLLAFREALEGKRASPVEQTIVSRYPAGTSSKHEQVSVIGQTQRWV